MRPASARTHHQNTSSSSGLVNTPRKPTTASAPQYSQNKASATATSRPSSSASSRPKVIGKTNQHQNRVPLRSSSGRGTPTSGTATGRNSPSMNSQTSSNNNNPNDPLYADSEEEDELAQLNAVDPRIAYANDLQQWGHQYVRLCADGATGRRFPFLLDFEHAEPPPLFNELVYHLPSERRHGVDKHLRRAGTIHLGCAELHDPRDEFASEEEVLKYQQKLRDEQLRKEQEEEKNRVRMEEEEEQRQPGLGPSPSNVTLPPEQSDQSNLKNELSIDEAESQDSNNNKEENGKPSPPPNAMPTGGFMLHATLFLQLRILNHTYYLAPVDSAHRDAVKKSIKRWIASARGPISPQSGNLLLRYAVTIPRPVVRKQIQKIADKARKEAMSSSQNNVVIGDPHAASSARRRSSVAGGAKSRRKSQEDSSASLGADGAADHRHQNKITQVSSDAPQLDQSLAESSEEPPGQGTDGISAAQFVFRDPFLCAVDSKLAQRASVAINNNNQHTAATAASASRRGSNILGATDSSHQPMNARVELAPPLATIEQELLHGITMRDHQSCCCPHRMDLPDVLQDGWAASVRASTTTTNTNSPAGSLNNNNNLSASTGNSSPSLSIPGSMSLRDLDEAQRRQHEQQQSQLELYEPPKLEEQTIHGALQVPHPFGHSLSFGMAIRHNTYGKLKTYSATSILEPLFSNNKKRRQHELSMESSFNMSSASSQQQRRPSAYSAGSGSGGLPPHLQPQAAYQTAPATIFVNQLLTSCTSVDNCVVLVLVAPANSKTANNNNNNASSTSTGHPNSTTTRHPSPTPGPNERLKIVGWVRLWIEPVLHPSLTLSFSVTNMFRKHFYPCDPMIRLQRKNAREMARCPVGSSLPYSSWTADDDLNANNENVGLDDRYHRSDDFFRFIPKPPPSTKLLHQTQTVFLSEAYHNRHSALFRFCDVRLPFSCVSCSEGKPVMFTDAVPMIASAWHAREKSWLSKKTKSDFLNERNRLAQLEKLHYGSTAQQREDMQRKQLQEQEAQIEEKRKKRRKLGAFVFIGTSSDDTEEEDRQLEEARSKAAEEIQKRRQSVDNATLTGFRPAAMHRSLVSSQQLLGQIESIVASQDHRLVLSAHFPYAMILPVKAEERKRAMAEGAYWFLHQILKKTGGETHHNSTDDDHNHQKGDNVFAANALAHRRRSSVGSALTSGGGDSGKNNNNSNKRRHSSGNLAAAVAQQEAERNKKKKNHNHQAVVYATVHDEFVVEVLDLLFDPQDGSTKPSVIGTSTFSLQSLIDAFSNTSSEEDDNNNNSNNKLRNIKNTINGLQPVRWHRDIEHKEGEYTDLLISPKMIELDFLRRTAFDDLHSRLRTSLDNGKLPNFNFSDRLVSFHPTTLRQDQAQVSHRFWQEKRDRFKKTSVNVGLAGTETAEESFARLFDRQRQEDNSRGIWDVGAMFIVDFCAGSSAAHNRRTFLDGSNIVRGALRLISSHLYPYIGWSELTACTTNAIDRQLALQTLQRVDENSYPNHFTEEQPFIDPCVDPIYETPRGVSELLKAYDNKVTQMSGGSSGNTRGGRRASTVAFAAGNNNSAFGSGGGGAAGFNSGMQMPFFLTPALRHARKVARQRAQQEMQMDKIESDRIERMMNQRQRQQQQKENTTSNNNNNKNSDNPLSSLTARPDIAVSASDWFGENNNNSPNKKTSNNNNNQSKQHLLHEIEEVEETFGSVPRRRLFVATVVVAGSEIADAKNAAKLLDDMQGEPIVVFLVIMRKSNLKNQQQQNNDAATTAFQNTQNNMFEAQIKEFQSKWNVIVTVLDISPDPADIHENFDRLAISIREIPNVFISTARCLSHGPKGLRPPVTKQSPLMVQAKRKQMEHQQKILQQQEKEKEKEKEKSSLLQQSQGLKSNQDSTILPTAALEEKLQEAGDSSDETKKKPEAGKTSDASPSRDNKTANDNNESSADENVSPSGRRRTESAIRHRVKLLQQKPVESLETQLQALRGALDESFEAYHPPKEEKPKAEVEFDAENNNNNKDKNLSVTDLINKNKEKKSVHYADEENDGKAKKSNKKRTKFVTKRRRKKAGELSGAHGDKDKKKTGDTLLSANDDEHPEHSLDFSGGRSRTRSAMIASAAGLTLHEDADTLKKRQEEEDLADKEDEWEEYQEEVPCEEEEEEEEKRSEDFGDEEEEFFEEEEEEYDDDEYQEAQDAYHEGRDSIHSKIKMKGRYGVEHISFKIFDPFDEEANESDSSGDYDIVDGKTVTKEKKGKKKSSSKIPRDRRPGTTTTTTSSSGDDNDDDDEEQPPTGEEEGVEQTVVDAVGQEEHGTKKVVTVLGPKDGGNNNNKSSRRGSTKQHHSSHHTHNRHALCDTSITLVDVFVEDVEEDDEDF